MNFQHHIMHAPLPDKATEALRNFANTFAPNSPDPFSGVTWTIFLGILTRDSRFSEFDDFSLASLFRMHVPLDDIQNTWDGSQESKDAVFQHIAKALDAHPRRYKFLVGMACLEPFSGYTINLSSDVKIFTDENNPHEAGNRGGITWLSIEASGFVPMFGRGSANDAIESVLKQVAYFLREDSRLRVGFFAEPTPHLLRQNDMYQVVTVPPDSSLLRLLASMQINISELYTSPGLLGTLASTPQERAAAFTKDWQRAQLFFGMPEGDAKTQLSAAIEWYIDSFLDSNESVAYLKACIGIESILGDAKQQMSELSRRLEDRYAFMIGRNRAERDLLGLALKKVLDLRGELVHARVRRLSREKRHLLMNARGILSQCISHEIKCLAPESPANTNLGFLGE